ncbi:MAG: aspartyl protease family protein [Bacteroidota bacterium]|nr:aspartyl protease family protein [Bacteroidota bacterium]
MIRFLFYIAFILCQLVSQAQEEKIEKDAQLIGTLPFRQLSGGVILLQAKFDQIGQPLNFILDTGSGGISLDSATTAEFKIPHVPSGRTINGIAGIREVDVSRNNALTFPGFKVDSLDFYINDYEILSSVYGEKIDGIIGYSFLSRYIVKINFDSLHIEVFKPGKINYPRAGILLHPLFTALPIQPLLIKDSRSVNANFYLDTGAGLCFLMSKQFVEDSSILMKRRRPIAVQVQGLGGKKEMLLTIIKQVQIGPYRFRKVPANILDDEFNATSYPFLGGLIGNDILRRFNIILNYPKREIHIVPNSHFNEEFDYSYTGMNMYSEDGVIVADDVIEGSPADRGGLKKGDVIVAVNANFSNNINVYRNLMQVVGEKITLLITRKDTPVILTFKVGRIF